MYFIIEETLLQQAFIGRNNKDGSVSYIPLDPANSDYQAYLKSLEDETNTL